MAVGPVAVVPHEWLPCWLQAQESEATGYTVSNFAELGRPADLADKLADMIMHAKCNPVSLRRLLARVGWLKASTRLAPSKRPQGRHGDFGEVLAIGLLQEFAEVHVPIVKLRVQMDSEQSLHGSDVVGFHWEEQGGDRRIVDLEFVEVKCRTTANKQQAATAHAQLVADRDLMFADTIEFIAGRLDELGQYDVLDAFESYLASREDDAGGHYRIVLIFDGEVWSGEELNQLPEEGELCAPLSVDVVLVEALRDLIDQTWAAVSPQLLSA